MSWLKAFAADTAWRPFQNSPQSCRGLAATSKRANFKGAADALPLIGLRCTHLDFGRPCAICIHVQGCGHGSELVAAG